MKPLPPLSAKAMATTEKPERLALEPWLYRLAMNALDQLSRPEGSNGGAVHLRRVGPETKCKGSDEAELQFHQPDEAITEETIIADDRVATPEQIVGSDEMMRLIASALHDVSPAHREAFILHAIEGFGVDEISAITGASPARCVDLHCSRARSPAQIAQPRPPIQRAVRQYRDGINHLSILKGV